jgi:hypothetical protein
MHSASEASPRSNTKVIKGARSKDNLKDADPIVEDNELEPKTLRITSVSVDVVSGKERFSATYRGKHSDTDVKVEVQEDGIEWAGVNADTIRENGTITFMSPVSVLSVDNKSPFGAIRFVGLAKATPETEITS